MRSVSRRLLVTVAVVGLTVVACSSAAPDVDTWNETRSGRGFDRSANREALAVLGRIERAGVECTATQTEDFDALVTSYRKAKLPLPLGSASCTGPGGENVLVEVFPADRSPTAADFVDRKRTLICAKGYELGAQPDGSNDFGGLPYVAGRSGTWIVEPDSARVNRRIAEALGVRPRNACPTAPTDG